MELERENGSRKLLLKRSLQSAALYMPGGIKAMEGLQRKTNCEITSRGSFTNKIDRVNGLKYFYLIFDVHQFGEESSCVSF